MLKIIILIFLSVVAQAKQKNLLPPDIVIIDGQVYKIQNPRFLKNPKSKKEFKKEPFYTEFMANVLEDPALITSKSKDPLFEIDDCISRGLADNRSLQASAINCYSKEIDPAYKGYGVWRSKDGGEVLSIPSTKSPFLVGYLTTINSPKEERNSKKEEQVTCLKNPSQADLNCYKYNCYEENSGGGIQKYSRLMSRRDWCGKTICPTGQAFLIENIRQLEYLYSRDSDVVRAELSRNTLGLSKKAIDQILDSPDNFDAMKACFACPPGSKMNDYGNQCFDSNGCDVVMETYSQTHKKCISKYENFDLNCAEIYKDFVNDITYMRDEEITRSSFYLGYRGMSGVSDVYIRSDKIPPEKKSKFLNELIVRSSQAIDRYNLRAKTCKDGEEIVDDFKDDFITMASQYECDENQKGQCKSASCIICEGKLQNFRQKFKTQEFSSLRSACGSDITGGFQINLSYYKYRDIQDKLRDCGSEFIQCPEFSLTEQEVIDYAIRAGFECARNIYVKSSPSKGSGKR